MPLLLCPNDNASMQAVQRSGVEFDICPTCRGVWLDRGELEKLLAAASEIVPESESGPDRPSRYGGDPRISPDREVRRDRDDGEHNYGRKKKRSSLFDIFD